MQYKFHHNDGTLEFSRNCGRIQLTAPDAEAALRAAREVFEFVRDVEVKDCGEQQFAVSFKVAFGYRLPMLRLVEKALKLLRSERLYKEGRYLDRYIVATVYRETGKPDFLAGREIKAEISSLRKAAVVAREVDNIISFVDWDICIYNYLELNNKDGFTSKIVRKSLV